MKNKWWGLLAFILISSHLAYAKWETYTDTVLYNFSVNYPENWTTEIHGNNLVIASPDGSDSAVIAGNTEPSEVEGGLDSCKSIKMAGQPAYDCPNGSFLKTRAIYFPQQKIIINQTSRKSRTAKKIISTFQFTSNATNIQPTKIANATDKRKANARLSGDKRSTNLPKPRTTQRGDSNRNPEMILLFLIGLGLLLFFLTPYIWVLLSGRSHGAAKFGWFLVTLFFSWLGLAAFLIITQNSKDRRS